MTESVKFTSFMTCTALDPHDIHDRFPVTAAFKLHSDSFSDIWSTASILLTRTAVFRSVFLYTFTVLIFQMSRFTRLPRASAHMTPLKTVKQ